MSRGSRSRGFFGFMYGARYGYCSSPSASPRPPRPHRNSRPGWPRVRPAVEACHPRRSAAVHIAVRILRWTYVAKRTSRAALAWWARRRLHRESDRITGDGGRRGGRPRTRGCTNSATSSSDANCRGAGCTQGPMELLPPECFHAGSRQTCGEPTPPRQDITKLLSAALKRNKTIRNLLRNYTRIIKFF